MGKFDGLFTDYRTRAQKRWDFVKLITVWLVLLMVLGFAFVGSAWVIAPYFGYEVKKVENHK